jgi:hypothetical protein
MPEATRACTHDFLKIRFCLWIVRVREQCYGVRARGNLKSRLTSDKHVWPNSRSENIMKKILSIGLLTLCALALGEREAHAWVNSKFSIGLNWHLQSGNNNILWGAWRNGQVPGPEAFGHPGGPLQFGPGPNHSPHMPPAATFPYFGHNPQTMPAGFPQETAPPPTLSQGYGYHWSPYGSYNAFQPVSYMPGYYPTYYYPSYYAYQAPYYWYQSR